MHLHLLTLLYHRFGSECISTAVSNVVRLGNDATSRKTFQKLDFLCFDPFRVPQSSPYPAWIFDCHYNAVCYFLVRIDNWRWCCCCCNWVLFVWHESIQTKTDQSTLLEQLIEFLEPHSSAKQFSTTTIQLCVSHLFHLFSLRWYSYGVWPQFVVHY